MPGGFSEGVVRMVVENGRKLMFTGQGFASE
jgi:hypothetical protein